MSKNLIATTAATLALIVAQAMAQQPAQQTTPPKPARLSFMDSLKRSLQRLGATVDESKSTADMVVSNYPDPRGGKTTIVIVNDRRKNLLGFYIYNFGNLKNVTNREDIYKYLLSANDAITIGSFFVDSEADVGYKYMVNNVQPISPAAFESVYLTMASVARERRSEIRQMLGSSSSKLAPPGASQSATEEK